MAACAQPPAVAPNGGWLCSSVTIFKFGRCFPVVDSASTETFFTAMVDLIN